jgi:hypothetical protein
MEKYYGMSPYLYCAGNPVNLVDPFGEHIWGLTASGTIQLIENSEVVHKLFLLTDNGAISDKVFTMDDDSVFEALAGEMGTSSYLVPLSNGAELLGLFFFLADNTSIEWAFHYNENEAVLGTTRNESATGNWETLGLSSKPLFSIHSHPNITPTSLDEYFSMGMNPVDSSYKIFNPIVGYDWYNVQNHYKTMADNYTVYFPNSKNVYRLAYPNKATVKNDPYKKYRK